MDDRQEVQLDYYQYNWIMLADSIHFWDDINTKKVGITLKKHWKSETGNLLILVAEHYKQV